MHDYENQIIRSTDDLPNTDLLGKRPPILFGCDTKEIASIGLFSFLFALPIAFLMAAFAGFAYFVLFFFVMFLVLMATAMLFLRSEKRQKPYGYYIQKFNRTVAGLAQQNSVYVQQSKGWDTRRHKQSYR